MTVSQLADELGLTPGAATITPRAALVIGKMVSAGIRGMSQVVVVLAGLSMTIAAAVNLSYVVEALRSLLLTGHLGRLPIDLALLAAAAASATAVSALAYPKVVT